MSNRITKQPFCQTRVIGRFYYVNIIGTGWLLFKWGFHKYDYREENPCFLSEEGYKIDESDYNEVEFAY